MGRRERRLLLAKWRQKEDLNSSSSSEDEAPEEDNELASKARLDRIRSTYVNKQKVLVFSSRGISYRHRHLMKDLISLLPHSKKDSKFDTKTKLHNINEITDIRNCNNCIFFEVRKGRYLYMWFSKTPNGPSMKFQALNVHTMNELNFTGNCLKGSRPVLCFDASFGASPHTKLMMELFSQIFGTPKGHPRSRPFIDHVFSFSWLDEKVWFRNYQIVDEVSSGNKGDQQRSLVEIGPRFVLEPIRILQGSFCGKVLWENAHYMSPTAKSVMQRRLKDASIVSSKQKKFRSREEKAKNRLVVDPLSDVFVEEEPASDSSLEASQNGEFEGGSENPESDPESDESADGSEANGIESYDEAESDDEM
ncbi:uncharacterized protein LOC126304757 isoform X3 [Schistocerca gregaria]|uniref:uncharacterized protein LOC126304757 isoform X3 n=1 Tax=Schistocerca gregaria TaxID=7010 RepID=UPI00211EB795|nr:uncharacterized protein LOC126304757 isoform X3 [Schistocerca gregaria]XP_049847895.1 uncharacterized protein LOC126304757 isoform X3 [Schistocerca gregaria]